MVTETISYRCPRCQSDDLVRNGTSRSGKQKYHCKSCGAYGTLNPSLGYSVDRKAEILRAYHERSSMRGLERTFGVARQTVAKWLCAADEQLPPRPPLDKAAPGDVLELDELWSFVGSKKTSAGSG